MVDRWSKATQGAVVYNKDLHKGKTAIEWAVSKLGKPESFIYEMGRIPRISRKIDALLLCISATEVVLTLKSSANAMHNAVGEVMESDRLRYMLLFQHA